MLKQNDAVDAILNRMDIGDLTEPQCEGLHQVIGNYQTTFSKDDDHLGFCDLVEHKIVTTDDKPIKVPHSHVLFEETLSRLETVLSRLSILNLKVKPEKCQFFRKRVSYLSHVVTHEGTSPNPEMVKAVSEWPRPETLHDLLV